MPKSRIPSVEITLGGEVRHLIYGHHALGELEEQAAALPTPASRIKLVVLALWAGLLTETLDAKGRETNRTLSRFEIAALLDTMTPDEIDGVAAKVLEAKGLAAPNPTKASETPAPAPNPAV